MNGISNPENSTCRSNLAQPVYIEGIFAWLHRRQPKWCNNTAVLICAPLGRDALDSHRFLRVLADEFASAGYPSLRFDYPGTGDSCDLHELDSADRNYWLAWQQSVQLAADYLIAETGANRLIFCGLRIGATLATLAAEKRTDVSGLILLAPVIRGQSYIRQLWVEASLQQGEKGKLHDGFKFQELAFSAAAVRSIADADLRTVLMPTGRQIAICAQSSTPPLAACKSAWIEQGSNVWSTNFTGLEPLLNHALEEEIPPADFSELISWTERHFPTLPTMALDNNRDGATTLQHAEFIETPISFGGAHEYFGMLCEEHTKQKDIVVILCGGARNPHYGLGRSSVNLARGLVKAGFPSLRIDFAGLGDSLGPPGREKTVTAVFEPRLYDIQAAIDYLETLGYSRFAVQGLCSGAFHAFSAALGDLRIGMLLLVNMPFFEESDDPCREVAVHSSMPLHHYVRRLARKRSWRRLLSGNYAVRAILLGQVHRSFNAAARLWRMRGNDTALTSFAAASLRQLWQRNVEILFLFGPDEVGLYAVERYFGPNGAELRRMKNVTLEIAENFEHSMAFPESQHLATRVMLAKLLPWRSSRRSSI